MSCIKRCYGAWHERFPHGFLFTCGGRGGPTWRHCCRKSTRGRFVLIVRSCQDFGKLLKSCLFDRIRRSGYVWNGTKTRPGTNLWLRLKGGNSRVCGRHIQEFPSCDSPTFILHADAHQKQLGCLSSLRYVTWLGINSAVIITLKRESSHHKLKHLHTESYLTASTNVTQRIVPLFMLLSHLTCYPHKQTYL